MIAVVPILSGYGAVLHVRVSVPHIACLIDGRKYMDPADVPPTDSHDDLHKIRRQKAARFAQAAKKRAPSLRFAGEAGAEMRQRRADGEEAQGALRAAATAPGD